MSRRTLAARLVVLALLVAGVAAAWVWRGVFDPAQLNATAARSPAAVLAFLALQIAASLFFVPRTLLAIGAGLLFGMWWGTLWAALGSVAGAVCGFLIARYLSAGIFDRIEPARLAALRQQAERGGWRTVAVVRLVPVIPHSLTNYALGLTKIGLGAYAIGSLLGQLPMTVAFVDLGAAGGRLLSGGDWRHHVLWPSLIGITALALSLAIPALLRRRQPVSPEAEA